MNIPNPPPLPVKILLKKALLVVLKAFSAVALLLVKLHRKTATSGRSLSVGMLLRPMETAPVFALRGILEIPVPRLLVKLESVMAMSGLLKISKTASEKFLHYQKIS